MLSPWKGAKVYTCTRVHTSFGDRIKDAAQAKSVYPDDLPPVRTLVFDRILFFFFFSKVQRLIPSATNPKRGNAFSLCPCFVCL